MPRVVLAVLTLALTAPMAQATDIGIGAFGGVSIPIVNDLSKQGSTFGVTVPVKVRVEQFTLVSTGSSGVYNIRVDDGLLVLVLDTAE